MNFVREAAKNQVKMPKDGNKMDDTPFNIKKVIEKNLLLITVMSGVIIGIILGKKKSEKFEKIDQIRLIELDSTHFLFW